MLPNIFLYVDYRQFLRDLYCALHSTNPRFSPQGFARLLGVRQPEYLTELLEHKANIDPATISLLALRLELNAKQRDYFEVIVSFDQAQTSKEKDKYFRKIIYGREYGPVKELEGKQYEFFSHWYNPVVRELVIHADYPDDPAWIADRLVPHVDPDRIAESIKLLCELGIIERDANRRWRQANRVISTPSEVISTAVARYHSEVIELGQKSLERFGPERRDIRAVTLGMPASAYPEVKKRMEAFWRELLDFGNSCAEVEQVFQVNMQLFPLTRDDGDDQ